MSDTTNPSRRLILAAAPAAAIGLGTAALPAMAAATMLGDPVFVALNGHQALLAKAREATRIMDEAQAACPPSHVEITIASCTLPIRDRRRLTDWIDNSYPMLLRKIELAQASGADPTFRADLDEVLSTHYSTGYSMAQFDAECEAALAKFDHNKAEYERAAKIVHLDEKDERQHATYNAAWDAEIAVLAVRPTSYAGAAALLIHAANYLSEGGEPEYALGALVSAAQFLDVDAFKMCAPLPSMLKTVASLEI